MTRVFTRSSSYFGDGADRLPDREAPEVRAASELLQAP